MTILGTFGIKVIKLRWVDILQASKPPVASKIYLPYTDFQFPNKNIKYVTQMLRAHSELRERKLFLAWY